MALRVFLRPGCSGLSQLATLADDGRLVINLGDYTARTR
jgi:hypothetical protein